MKKQNISIYLSLLTGIFLVFASSCEKENIPPTCEIISPSNGAEYDVGDKITISVEAEDEDGTIQEVRFYIDDIGVASSSSWPYNYEWNTEGEDDGIKKIKVSVKDDRGATVEDKISILLELKEPPVADFKADKTTISEGESVQFSDQSTNEPTIWSWEFGDGNKSTQKNPIHSYSTAGMYTVELTATNEMGFGSETKTNYITVTGETVTFTDARDGKAYKTVKIGTQVWMAENLAYLPSVVGSGTGSNTTLCHYVYGYDGTSVSEAKATSNYQTYGVLYNWPAAIDACPSGWHLPTDAEWTQLTDYLGGASVAGDKLKETGTTHWRSPNTGATNESGFTALPGGFRFVYGGFDGIGIYGFWWSATEDITDEMWCRSMSYNDSSVGRVAFYESYGFSVRCVKDD